MRWKYSTKELAKAAEVVYQRRYREKNRYSLKYRAHCLYSAAVHRARRCGTPCTITKKWVEDKLRIGKCEVSGLDIDYGKTQFHKNPYAPSLDQIKAAAGYTMENTRMVIWAVNAGQETWGTDIYLEVAAAAVAHQNKLSGSHDVIPVRIEPALSRIRS